MKVKIKVIKETELEADVQFPVFLKDMASNVYFMFTEIMKCMIVKKYDFSTCIEWTHHICLQDRFMNPNYAVITKQEFKKAFDNTKTKLEKMLNEMCETK